MGEDALDDEGFVDQGDEAADEKSKRSRAGEVASDEEGRVSFRGLAPGTYRIELEDWPEDIAWKMWTSIPAGTRAMTLQLERGAEIHGVAVRADGQPPGEDEGWVLIARESTGNSRRLGAMTDARGEFRFNQLVPGRLYNLYLWQRGDETVLQKGIAAGSTGVRLVIPE